MRFRLRLMFAWVGILSIALFCVRVWYVSILPVLPSKVAQLQVGMSAEQVRELLGKPDRSDENTWTYSKDFRVNWFKVYFDDNLRLFDTDAKPAEIYYPYPYRMPR